MTDYLASLFSLRGRTALVTGGSSGIGKAMATALAGAGANVVLAARDPERLERAARELRAEGGRVAAAAGDLAEPEGVDAVAAAAVEQFGEPDILLCAAGVNPRPPFAEQSPREWERVLKVNLTAPFLLGRRFGPGMAERGYGRILNIGSQQSIRAFGDSGAYGVSKSAVCALTRSQAEAWSAAGVCCNTVAPGFVRTPLTEPTFAQPERPAQLAARTMAGRNGVPEDFAGVAVFLASRASDYVTGQTIFVDGGFSAT